jgi:CubicO group peptidase (beta-lactamase class C family)
MRHPDLLVALAWSLGCAPVVAGPPSAPGGSPAVPVAERVARVEHGLAPPVVIKGEAAPSWTIAERLAFWKVPGISVAVIDGGRIAWARGYGVLEAGGARPVEPDTLFQAASISKPIASLGALLLVQEGRLSLDADVNDKLLSWKVPATEQTRQSKVTLARLLSHTAGMTIHGFGGYASGEPVPTLLQILDGQKPANSAPIRVNYVPGSESRYSGGGFTVVQQLVIDVTGQPFSAFIHHAVLDPLGMKHSAYERPSATAAAAGHDIQGRIIGGKWHTYPELAAAGLWTTPSDLARFAIELQRSHAGEPGALLTRTMTERMLTAVKAGYGLGMAVQGQGAVAAFSHGGSNAGFKCVLFAYVERGQGAVVMSNGDGGANLADEILRSIAREYGWPDHRPRERTAVPVDPRAFGAYVGKYEIPGRGTIAISTENGRLFVQAPPFGPKPIELHAESDERYFVTLDEVTLTFVKDTQGVVTEILAQPPGNTIHARKVK